MIKKASVNDANEACEVIVESIVEVCGPDYEEIPGYIEKWLSNKTPSTLRQWIEHDSNEFLISHNATGEINGVSCIGKNGEVFLCYVKSAALGKGIGKALVSKMKEVAANWGLSKIIAHSTVTAKDFYLSQGFEDTLEIEKEGDLVVEHKLIHTLKLKTTG